MKRILLFLIFLPSVLMAQHTIEGTFLPAGDFTYAFLYKSNATGAMYVNRAKIDATGYFKIEMDSSETAGIYKIVYGVPQEDYNFDLIYNGAENVVLTFSLDGGLEFKESNENKLWASYTNSIEMINRTISNYYAKESVDQAAFMDIFKTLKETQDAFELASKNTLAATFIKANAPYVPKTYEDRPTYSKHLKNTYLDRVDFSNPLLQSSEFLTDRIMAYIFGMSPDPTEAFYKQQIDNLVGYIGEGNDEIKLALLRTVWHAMIQIEEDTVALYLADTYLFELAEKAEDDLLLTVLTIEKNTAIGAKAIDFPLNLKVDGQNIPTTLHELDLATTYLLIFWNSGCSHCLQQLPEIRNKVDEMDSKSIKVVAYATQGDTAEWRHEITKYPNFIHVVDSENSGYYVSDAYGVRVTPTYFLLDKDKKIEAKPDTLEELLTLLDDL